MKTRDEIQRALLAAITAVAPEADPSAIDRTRPIRDQLDIDSMDFLKIVVALHETLGVDVPERDYPKLATLDSSVAYLFARLEKE
jgi:acyl carrier protein